MYTPEELKEAVIRYKTGDESGFTRMYQLSERYLYVCIRNILEKQHDAEDAICDVMQDTYLEISKNIGKLEDAGKFLSWASTIANRKCFAYLKKNGTYQLLDEENQMFDNLADDEAMIPESILQDREKQRLLRDMIGELSPMQKICIIGYYYNEQKQSEIAKELGIPENTVKTNLSRAKASIREKVLALEKNKGTKLYTVAPILLLLFNEDVQACVIPPEVSGYILSAIQHGIARQAVNHVASQAGSRAAKEAVKHTATGGIKAKFIAGIMAAAMLGSGAGATVYKIVDSNSDYKTSNKTVREQEVEEKTEPIEEQPVVEEKEEQPWQKAYEEILANHSTQKMMGLEQQFGGTIMGQGRFEQLDRDFSYLSEEQRAFTQYTLYDIDENDIPELLLYAPDIRMTAVFTYDEGLIYCGTFASAYIGKGSMIIEDDFYKGAAPGFNRLICYHFNGTYAEEGYLIYDDSGENGVTKHYKAESQAAGIMISDEENKRIRRESKEEAVNIDEIAVNSVQDRTYLYESEED